MSGSIDLSSLVAMIQALQNHPIMQALGQIQQGPVQQVADPSVQSMPGRLVLNQPAGTLRPFGPGEYLSNPNGSWSNEITMTVQDPSLNNGQPTVVPSLWIQDGKAVRATNEDQAAAFAAKSGLRFPSFQTMPEAEKFANQRETNWQNIEPQNNGTVTPLWTKPDTKTETIPSKQ